MNNNLLPKLLWILLSPLGRVHVSGLHNLSNVGGKVIVCNHIGWADPIWLGYAVFPRKLHQMAKIELFKKPIISWFIRQLGGFPVDRAKPSPTTLKHSFSLVKSGESLLLFPGGTRSREAVEAKRGAAYIALKGNVPVIPAAYMGPETISWRDLWRRPKIYVHFGEPVHLPNTSLAEKLRAEELVEWIENALRKAESELNNPML